jgi:hypothetical protein
MGKYAWNIFDLAFRGAFRDASHRRWVRQKRRSKLSVAARRSKARGAVDPRAGGLRAQRSNRLRATARS